jgi:hypothetical protein
MRPGRGGQEEGEASPAPASTTEYELLLNFGIVGYDNDIRHLQAMSEAGVDVPSTVWERLLDERQNLIEFWLDPEEYNPIMLPTYLNEARRWVEEHIGELDDLLTRKGII